MVRRPRPPGRERMVATAAGLLARRGMEGTSFAEVLKESGAPRGSIYYYFPEGKQELLVEAVRWTTDMVLGFQRTCRARTPGGVVHHFVGFFRRSLRSSRCEDGCPLAAVAVSSYGSADDVRRLVRTGFRSWASVLTAQLRRAGLEPRPARNLALATIAAVEGALILARAEGSVRPLAAVDRHLRALADTVR